MEKRIFTVSLSGKPSITLKVIPGHFTTSNSHISHYLDVSDLNTDVTIARDVAGELAVPYMSTTLVDTIVCMEGTEIIGAFMAQGLLDGGNSAINSEGDIHVIRPMSNVNGKLVFQSNTQSLIYNRNIILLVASISSGKSISSAMECLAYYGGNLVGISALFNAISEESAQEVYSLFTHEDIADYQIFNPGDCEMCKKGLKLDAIVNSEGYTKM